MTLSRHISEALWYTVFLIALGAGSMAGPLAAQTQSGEAPQSENSEADAPLIDLGPLLDTLEPETEQTDSASDQPVTIPEYQRAPESGAVTAASAVPDTMLLPLRGEGAGSDRILRLSGERSTTVLTVDVAFPESAEAVVLAYRNSINVLPGRSELLIRVNGTQVPPVTPAAFEGFVNIELPRDLLVEGSNEIEVTAVHAHRIFCGPEATFQIWTEIDLAQSGVRLPRGDVPAGKESFATALAAQMALNGSVPVRIAPDASAETIRQLAVRLSGVTGIAATGVTRESLYDIADPLPPIARITVLDGPAEPARVERGADGAMVLVVVRDPDAGDGLPDLGAELPSPAPLEDIGQIEPGVATSLQDLKFTDTNAYNRYSEQRLPFRLPDDWLMLSSSEAMLRLTYSFAEGLPEGAIMLVKVNETTVRLLPLDVGGGEVLEPLDIGFSANLLKPGPNLLNFVAIVPGDPVDQQCPVTERPLVTILDDSTLRVPPTPHMTFVGLRSALTSMRADQVMVAQTSSEQSLTDEMALALVSALRPLDGRKQDENGRLAVAGVGTFENVPFAGMGLTRRELENVLMEPMPMTQIADETPMFRFIPLRPIAAGARSMFDGFINLAKPGDGALNTWLEGRNGQAVLMMPDPEAPNDLWLVVSADSDPVQVADTVSRARMSPDGPRGRLSILTEEGTWQSWQDAGAPPVLKEPLTFRNFRAVAGNYASWSPLYFSTVLFFFTVLSVVLALIFVVSTRGKRKR